MRNIIYKYEIGDTVMFKCTFHPTASCSLLKLSGKTAVVTDRRDYNGPVYKLEGYDGYFTEDCFAGRYEE